MKVKIEGVLNGGDLEQEKTVLSVNGDTDFGEYAVFRSRLIEGSKVSTTILNVYWPTYINVQAGDLIVLFTKKGQDVAKKTQGRNIHFLFWGLDHAIWDKDNIVPILLHAPDWEIKKDPKDIKLENLDLSNGS